MSKIVINVNIILLYLSYSVNISFKTQLFINIF